MASRSLGTLTLDLVTQTGGWVQGMDKAQRASKKWRKQVQADLRVIGKAFAGAATVAAAGVTALTVQGLAFVDSQAKMARQVGASIDGLRGLQIAANDAGVSTDVLNGAVDRMNARLGEAREGSGQAYEALEKLGLSADELAKMDADVRIATIADRVKELGLDSADTANLLRDLGIRNREMVNLLMQGGEAIRQARLEVDEYGLSLSAIDAAKVEKANDQFGRLPRLLEPIRTSLAIAVAEPLEGISNHILDATKNTRGFRDEVGDMADSVVEKLAFVINAGSGLARIFKFAGAAIATFGLGAQQVLKDLEASIYEGPVDAINFLIKQWNRIPGIDIGGIEQTDAAKEARAEADMLEKAVRAGMQDMKDIMLEPLLGDALMKSIEAARGSTQVLGGTGAGMINPEAIAAANTLVDSQKRLTEATEDSTESEEDKTEATKDTTDAVKGLGDASSMAARAMAAMGGGGKGALGTVGGQVPAQSNGLRSVRQNIEAGKDLTPYWLDPNPTARPTHSTDYGPQGYAENAARVSASANFSSIAPRGLADTAGAPAARNMGHITLTVKGENGDSQVEGDMDEAFVRLLEAAAAGSSPR